MFIKIFLRLFFLLLISAYSHSKQQIPFVEADIAKSDNKTIISIIWKTASGELKNGRWLKRSRDVWFRKTNPGCGLEGFCDRDALIIKYFDDQCIYVNVETNNYGNFMEFTSFKLHKDAQCETFSKDYLVESVSSEFEITDNSVTPLSNQFSFRERVSFFDIDVSADGTQILSTGIIDENQNHQSIFHFDLKNKKATKITFPNILQSYAGFINERSFVVAHRLGEYVDSVPERFTEFADGNLGLIFKFNKKFIGKPVSVVDKNRRGKCQSDIPTEFDVSHEGLEIATSTPGVCGHREFHVVADWYDEKLKIVRLDGLGDTRNWPGSGGKSKEQLFFYGEETCYRTHYSGTCNTNDNFYQVNFNKNSLTVSKEIRNGIVINDKVPQKGHLIPVWEQSYNGLEDISSRLYAVSTAEYLHLEVHVKDDHQAFTNKNTLHSDHVEIWLATYPLSTLGREAPFYSGWLGQSHYLLGDTDITLLDTEFYERIGIDSQPLEAFSYSMTTQRIEQADGYKQKLSIPLKALPFYQTTDGEQCFQIMIDVIDVDESGKQEALLSNNLSRKWGRRDYAPTFCFHMNLDFSLDELANTQGLTANMGSYTIVARDADRYIPMQIKQTEKKVSHFSPAKKINYKKYTLVDVSESQLTKLIHAPTGYDNNCPIKRASYAPQNDLLIIVADCGWGGGTSNITVYKLGDEALFFHNKPFHNHCYRHCVEKGYDVSSMEYGVLDHNVQIIQIGEAALLFTLDGGYLDTISKTGFPKLAQDVHFALEKYNKDLRANQNENSPIFYTTKPILLAQKELDIRATTYTSSFLPYTSASNQDIQCLEKLAAENLLEHGVLELPTDIPSTCISKHFDQTQLTQKIIESARPINRFWDYSIVLKYSDLAQLKNIDVSTTSLHIWLNTPDELHLIQGLAKLDKLKKLKLSVGATHGLNEHLSHLSHLNIESFSIHRYAGDDNLELAIPFGRTLKYLHLEGIERIKEDLILPNVIEADVTSTYNLMSSVAVFKVLPNLESLATKNLTRKMIPLPESLKHLKVSFLPKQHEGFDISSLNGVESLSSHSKSFDILGELSELDIPRIYIDRYKKRIVNSELIRLALSKYYNENDTNEAYEKIIRICHRGVPSDVKIKQGKVLVGPNCIASAL